MLKGPNQLDERVPVEIGTIQVNFCKNPHCQNFGIPASTKRQPRGMVGKLLDIFRVFYNFVEVGKNKQTPAMRLGLAKGKLSVEDIIYYQQ